LKGMSQMSKRIQTRREKPAAVQPPVTQEPQVSQEMIHQLQQTIQELQTEVLKLKAKVAEEQIARRDKLLMENLREIRMRKQKGLWNRVVQFTMNR
jgi:hypothetical protein